MVSAFFILKKSFLLTCDYINYSNPKKLAVIKFYTFHAFI